jgi:hypothetical protein
MSRPKNGANIGCVFLNGSGGNSFTAKGQSEFRFLC